MKSTKIKVRLINANMVKEELRLLDRAEMDRDCKSKDKSVSVAKRLVRESVVVQAIPGADAVRYVSSAVYQVYKSTFRDVGEDTFVYDAKSMKSVIRQLSALVVVRS